MSDGGISLARCFGFGSNELVRTVWIKSDWEKDRWNNWKAKRAELDRAFHVSIENPHRKGKRSQENKLPTWSAVDGKVQNEKIAMVASGTDPFPEWHWKQDLAIDAIDAWNGYIDWLWDYQFCMEKPRPKTAAVRVKEGFTRKMTPKEWLSIRDNFKQFQIAPAAYTREIWRTKIEEFQTFLTGGELPGGVSMDRGRPKVTQRVAQNIIWYLQEVMHCGCPDSIECCNECGSVFDRNSSSGQWCAPCGKMRCESCATYADMNDDCDHECQCSNCAKHCECEERKGCWVKKKKGK